MPDAAPLAGTASAPRDRIFWSLLFLVAVMDFVTKRWAERALGLHAPEEVVGRWVRWTLTYNTGAAMNLSLGGASRIVFSVVALGMIAYLFRLYRQSPRGARATPAAIALIMAGALGNLFDRLRHTRGVVDFIDIGTDQWRFWTFNVADMGVTCGAILLALMLWREGAGTARITEHSSPAQGPET
ncbi:MAG: signal peptidase II [Gemmatimonadota bacterium]|nr:signal peptidase II [Gemmatimonadota bacterium]